MSDKNNCFKEAVCIEVPRIFDSCTDRDCIYELPVTLSEDSPAITDEMNIVRARCVGVETTCILVEPVPFKSGYYSVDITYRFKITAEAFSKNFCQPTSGTLLCGTALWNKRVILYGGEGNAKVFTSEQDFSAPASDTPCDSDFCNVNGGNQGSGLPTATIHIVDPVSLDAKLICVPCGNQHANVCPSNPCCCNTNCEPQQYERTLAISLGLFSIVQLSRPVSLIVPAYDYCIPCKDCSAGTNAAEAPCEIFNRIDFPTDQFFPQPNTDTSSKCGCGAVDTNSDE